MTRTDKIVVFMHRDINTGYWIPRLVRCKHMQFAIVGWTPCLLLDSTNYSRVQAVKVY